MTHPHAAAVAAGVAAVLEARDALGLFITGIAAAPGTIGFSLVRLLARRFPTVENRVVNVSRERLRSLARLEARTRAWAALMRSDPYDQLFVAHDAAVAAAPWPVNVTSVYAYEDAALSTFRRARDSEMERVWDLPLPHFRTIERILRDERARWPDAFQGDTVEEPLWKQSRKDEELRLATKVCVASRFTRDSLEGVGVDVPVAVVPYGFPVEHFEARTTAPTGQFTVLSVGTHDLRKGTPYLLEAWRRAGLRDARLRVIGPLRLSDRILARYAGLFEHVPHVAKSRLGEEYRSADMLAFPTLGDGFGLVIQEAMCCGIPVVTTRCGGGPECITDGVEGWIVPERDPDALAERFRQAARRRDELVAMGRAARRRAEAFTWVDSGRLMLGALGLHVADSTRT